MAALTKNAFSVMGRDRAKRTKISVHKGYKSQITNIFKNSISKNAISVTVRDRAKWTKIWDHKGYRNQMKNIFKN